MKIVKNVPEELNLLLYVNGGESYLLTNKLNYETKKIDLYKRLENVYMKKKNYQPVYDIGLRRQIEFRPIRNESYELSDVEYKWNIEREGAYGSGKGIGCFKVDELMTEEEIFEDLYIIVNFYLDKNVCLMKKYKIYMEKNNFFINFQDEIKCIIENNSMKFNDQEIKEVELFFNDTCYFDYESFEQFCFRNAFDNHLDYPGFKDIWEKYKNIITNRYYKSRATNLVLRLKYFSEIITDEYYSLCEYFIKNNEENECLNNLPVFSSKPFPDVKNIHRLSKVSNEIIAKYNRNNREMKEILTKMETDKRFGVNNIKLLDEIIESFNKIYIEPFSIWRICEFYGDFYKLIQIFNITPKNLIEKIIRAAFYENVSPNRYINYVLDYYEMCKQLGIDYDKKIPKDIISQHDILQEQIEYIENKQKEISFKNKTRENSLLLPKFVDENLEIICPLCPNDLIQEGLKMHHCVGSYIDRYINGSSKIFFVRKIEDKDNPFVTVELDNKNNLVQAKAFANAKPDKKCLDYIKKWVESIGGLYE